MYIQTDNRINYTSLYRGGTITEILGKRHTKKFEAELNSVENLIKSNKLHKKENVDIILNYTKQDGFYGVISSKAEGVPMNPASRCSIGKSKESVNNFTSWVNGWNESYSPEVLQKMRDLMDFVKNGFKK